MTANAVNGLALSAGRWVNHILKTPYRILVLNLMPDKMTTELQFLRQFDDLGADCELIFAYPQSHNFKHPELGAKVKASYVCWPQLMSQYFAGMIVTGAPVEKLPFAQVDYWEEFRALCLWSRTHTGGSLFECWAAQAALYCDFGITKKLLPHKLFGIYRDSNNGLVMPQSRNTTSMISNMPQGLKIISTNLQAGPMILADSRAGRTYITGHPEYDADTLAQEYYRDRRRGIDIAKPRDYFKRGGAINYCWRRSSRIIYSRWLASLASTWEKAAIV